MNTVESFLEKAGLSDIETKIYLKLLEKGPKSVQELAQILEMNRTTMYNYMNPLMDKGLVIRMVKGAHTMFSATEIDESLTNLVGDKVESAQQIQGDLPGILQKMHAAFVEGEADENFEIKYYKGKNGVRKIYEDALNAKEVRCYVNLAVISKYLPENSQVFASALVNNPGIKVYEILDGSNESREHAKNFDKYSQYLYKFLPENISLSSADTLIYDGKVSIIDIREKVTGVVLKHDAYYKNSKELFDFVWQILRDEK